MEAKPKAVFDPTRYPDEFTSSILAFLPYKDVGHCRATCKLWDQIGGEMQKNSIRLLKEGFWLRHHEFVQVNEKGWWV